MQLYLQIYTLIDATHLLIFHSYFRWLVLLIMLVQILWIYINYKRNIIFSAKDFKILLLFTLVFDIQLIIGWSLYFNSMLVEGFWADIAKGIKNRQLRFFGLEHMSMMNLAIILINISTIRSYFRINTTYGFKKLWNIYIWIYLIILSSIPWSFSPLTSRPNFR